MGKLFLIIIFFLGSLVYAQAQDSESERPQRDFSNIIDSRVEDLTERLTLTDDQVVKVRAIYEKTLGVEVSEENGVSSSDQRHNEIMELLNDEQKEIYKEYLEERENRFQRRGGIQLERA